MKLPEFLEKQLLDFVDIYKKNYQKTFNVTLLLSILFFIIADILLKASRLGNDILLKPEIIWQFFFKRYSVGSYYCVADLAKIVFIFLISFFAIPFYRVKSSGYDGDLFSKKFFENITAVDFVCLVTALLVSCCGDYFLVLLNNILLKGDKDTYLSRVINDFIFQFRIYIPLIIFSLVSCWRLGIFAKFTIKKLLFLYISIWLFNEFSYESMIWIRMHIFSLIMIIFHKNEFYSMIENVLCIPFTAFYFLGFSSAMVHSMEILNEEIDIDALATTN